MPLKYSLFTKVSISSKNVFHSLLLDAKPKNMVAFVFIKSFFQPERN